MSSSLQPPSPPRRVAIVSGGTRGIGRGISEALAATGEFGGLLLTYNTDRDAADSFADELRSRDSAQKVELVGGDLSLKETRDAVFAKFDEAFGVGFELCVVVHNAGQYIGITSENAEGLYAPPGSLLFGDGSLLAASEDGSPDMTTMKYYQRLYGDAYIDLCERGLDRMRRAIEHRREMGDDGKKPPFRGSLIGISGQGCNFNQRVSTTYDMPGSGKCIMEYAMRIFAVRAAPLGVNCNVIIPGVTRTDAWTRLEEKRGMPAGKLREMVVGTVPMGEDIDPKEIGDAVAFLCSSTGGGKFITGVSLPVDGGLHLGKPPSFRAASK